MNKKLMAVAVGAALAAPGLAFAQAAQVQLYGLIDMNLRSDRYSNSTAAAAAGTDAGLRKHRLHTTAPRIGVRGTEDLGGGLAAHFQLEAGVNPDGRAAINSGASGYFGGRDSWFGFRGSWGDISFGGFGSAYKDVSLLWNAVATQPHFGIIMNNGDTTGAIPTPNCLSAIAVTGAVTAGGAGTDCQGGSIEGNATSFHRRPSDHLQYTTPTFSGFRFKVGTQFAEYKETPNANPTLTRYNPSSWMSSLTWAGGPFQAGVAYEMHRGFRATNTAGTDRNAKDTGWQVGFKWNFGQGLLGLGWEKLKYGNAAAAGAENNFDLTNWVVNGSWNITSTGTISLGYSKTPGAKSCGAGLTSAANTCGSPTAANMTALSYDHRLSKRTGLYAVYARINNNAGATYYYIVGPTSNNNGGDTGGLPAGSDVTTYAVGIKHTF